jgi:hypothetical protein
MLNQRNADFPGKHSVIGRDFLFSVRGPRPTPQCKSILQLYWPAASDFCMFIYESSSHVIMCVYVVN